MYGERASLEVLRKLTCPCGHGYWDVIQEQFINGERVRQGAAPSRSAYETEARAKLGEVEFEARIREQYIKHFLDCGKGFDLKNIEKERPSDPIVQRAITEWGEIQRGDFVSRGRSQSVGRPGKFTVTGREASARSTSSYAALPARQLANPRTKNTYAARGGGVCFDDVPHGDERDFRSDARDTERSPYLRRTVSDRDENIREELHEAMDRDGDIDAGDRRAQAIRPAAIVAGRGTSEKTYREPVKESSRDSRPEVVVAGRQGPEKRYPQSEIGRDFRIGAMDTKIRHRPLEEPGRRSHALCPWDESLDDVRRTSKELREITRPEEDDRRRDDRVTREERHPRQSSGSLFPRGRSPNNAQEKLEGPQGIRDARKSEEDDHRYDYRGTQPENHSSAVLRDSRSQDPKGSDPRGSKTKPRDGAEARARLDRQSSSEPHTITAFAPAAIREPLARVPSKENIDVAERRDARVLEIGRNTRRQASPDSRIDGRSLRSSKGIDEKHAIEDRREHGMREDRSVREPGHAISASTTKLPIRDDRKYHQDQRSRDSGYGTSTPANSPGIGRTNLPSRKDVERAVAQKLKASGETEVARTRLDQLVDEYLEKLTGRSREDRGSGNVRDSRTVREGIR